jgi:hypothetical protein
MSYVALPLRTSLKRGLVTAAMRLLFNDQEVVTNWQQILSAAGDMTPRIIKSKTYIQLAEQQKLAVFLDAYVAGTRQLRGADSALDPPHSLLFLDLVTKQGFSTTLRHAHRKDLADFILFAKQGSTITVYVSLPTSARTETINVKLQEGARQTGDIKLTPILTPAPISADVAGPVLAEDGPTSEFNIAGS